MLRRQPGKRDKLCQGMEVWTKLVCLGSVLVQMT